MWQYYIWISHTSAVDICAQSTIWMKLMIEDIPKGSVMEEHNQICSTELPDHKLCWTIRAEIGQQYWASEETFCERLFNKVR